MSVKHIDRRIGSAARNSNPSGHDRREETFSEYFDPKNADRKVLRYELLGVLTRYHKARENMRWYNRLWRYLKAAVGSGSVKAVEEGDLDLTVKGEPVEKPAE